MTRTAPLYLAATLLLAACSSAAGSPPPTATDDQMSTPSPASTTGQSERPPTARPTETVAPSSSLPTTGEPTAPPAAATDEPAPATPTPPPVGGIFEQPWATATLTDVTSGEQFTLAELAASGRVVFIETMAIWCSSCRAQQREAVSAFAGLDPAKVVWVGLDIEATETAEALARYREDNQFPFRYAIADRDLSRALVGQFGDVVLSPPSVNLIILATDGTVTHLRGPHGAAELIALAAEHGA